MGARQERRTLKSMERALGATDPVWVKTVGGRLGAAARINCALVRLLIDTAGFIGVALGVASLVFPLIFLGCLLLVTGACMHITAGQPGRRAVRDEVVQRDDLGR